MGRVEQWGFIAVEHLHEVAEQRPPLTTEAVSGGPERPGELLGDVPNG